MNAAIASWFPYAFPFFFLGLWLFVTTMFRWVSGFSWKTSRDYAHVPVIDRALFGSGQIRGIGYRSCLHLLRVDGGFLVRVSRLFGGGSRFIADGDLVRAERSTSFFWIPKLAISLRNETLVFYGGSAAFMARHLTIPVGGDAVA
jgi:hypothetical protein